MKKETGIPNVKNAFEMIASEICDHYCKWPDLYFTPDGNENEEIARITEEHCEKCPLVKFLTD